MKGKTSPQATSLFTVTAGAYGRESHAPGQTFTHDPEVKKRLGRQAQVILDRLRQGPATTAQFCSMMLDATCNGPGHRTIITANMDLNELAERIDPATARSIAEGLVLNLETPTKITEMETHVTT